MNPFRFIHTADVHLDSPLKGLAKHEGSAADSIRTATRAALHQLVGLAIEEQVSFLIIAGDLYDGDWRDYRTGLYFVSEMGRLHRSGIPVYLLYGNHDARSQITRRLTLPGNVYVFGSRRPQSFAIDSLNVVLHGQSFRQRDVTDNLALNYPEPFPGAFNIGVLHTGLGGTSGHENYAPCALADLIGKGYDYWALGHVHRAEVLHSRPHIVFPGNLQGRHVRETGAKGATMVTIDNGEISDLETLPCDVVRWTVVTVDLGSTTSFGEVLDRIRDALDDAVDTCSGGRLLACRIVLQGRTEVHGRLLTDEEQLLAEARSVALGLGDDAAWVEKVIVETEPAIAPETLEQREDAVGELLRMLQKAGSDTDLLHRLETDIGGMVRRLPSEVRSAVEDTVLKAAVDGDHAALIGGAAPFLTARLTEGRD
ncbi:MAG: DNA repair exonuclease [Candidatus Aminicenantes bacterium]|nr:DNA repair exonuclease [Candidatus Aminicenantes bacterium]